MNKIGLLGCGAVVLIVAAIFFFMVVGGYNSLVSADEGVKSAWSQVENVYQRRADLIPNLVATVKGVANFEKETYTAVTEARAKVGSIKVTPEMLSDPNAIARFHQAQDELSSALSRLLDASENYPELKANQNFLDLQSQLEGTENRISVERRNFNQTAQTYNTMIRRVPKNIIASLFGFKEKAYFAAAEGSDKAPEVKF